MGLLLSGFGDSEVNGVYSYTGQYNGQNKYQKGVFHIIYKNKNGPISFDGAYYIAEEVSYNGSVPVLKFRYKLPSTDITNTGWVALDPQDSGTTVVGEIDEISSSSGS
jgi:hypothetical protein